MTRRALLLGAAVAAAPLVTLSGQEAARPGAVPAAPPRPAAELPESLRGSSWKLVHEYAEGRATFDIADLAFVSPRIGVAAGSIIQDGAIRENIAMCTRDGGETWTRAKLRDMPVSLFGLDEAHLWMVTRKNLWISADGGTSWQKLKLPKKCARVCFVTRERGFAYGAGKIFWRTEDSGKQWSKVPESEQIQLTDGTTSWRTMEFVTPEMGMIAGISRRDTMSEEALPDWMMPERALRRRVRPSSTATMVTNDGGKTWKASMTSTFGRLDRIRLSGKRGAGLFHFGDGFAWPSEVMAIDLITAKSEPLFRRPELRVTDLLLTTGGGYILGAISPLGRLTSAGLPGKVKMIYSPDGKSWYEMKVDYRAEGVALVLASGGDGRIWAATDSGMILRCDAAANALR